MALTRALQQQAAAAPPAAPAPAPGPVISGPTPVTATATEKAVKDKARFLADYCTASGISAKFVTDAENSVAPIIGTAVDPADALDRLAEIESLIKTVIAADNAPGAHKKKAADLRPFVKDASYQSYAQWCQSVRAFVRAATSP